MTINIRASDLKAVLPPGAGEAKIPTWEDYAAALDAYEGEMVPVSYTHRIIGWDIATGERTEETHERTGHVTKLFADMFLKGQ